MGAEALLVTAAHEGARLIQNSYYDEEDVEAFGHIIENRDFDRIQDGLAKAIATLKPLAPEKRKAGALDQSSIFALFEALACEPFLGRQGLLSIHFDEAFALVQTNRPLTVAHFVPAMTIFQFQKYSWRTTWAKHNWRKLTDSLTEESFDFAVRRALSRELDIILMAMPNSEGVERFWTAMQPIVQKLTPGLITHSLRSMDQDIYRLGLDHLQVDSPGLIPLLQCFQTLLTMGPRDFWDAMGAIAPTTVIEQVFNNPHLDRFVQSASGPSLIKDLLGWISPFMASLQTLHKPPACRALAFQLLDRLQSSQFPEAGRDQCFSVGVGVLSQTLADCNKINLAFEAVDKVAATDTLGVLSDRIQPVIAYIIAGKGNSKPTASVEACASTLVNATRLECSLMRSDRNQIRCDQPLPPKYMPYSPVVWEAIRRNIQRAPVLLAHVSLLSMAELTGLEGFESKQSWNLRKERDRYNLIIQGLSKTLVSILEQISDSSPEQLNVLQSSPRIASHLLVPLFSSDHKVSESGADLLKTICDAQSRRDALSLCLTLRPRDTLHNIVRDMTSIAKRKAFAPCSRMLKICTDVVEILCNSRDGILRTTALFADSKDMVRSFWASLWETLHTIYKETQQWSEDIRVVTMTDFCRDVMQFSESLVNQASVFDSATNSDVSGANLSAERQEAGSQGDSAELLVHPSQTLTAMIKYLKLRDEYLLSTSVDLIQKLLRQLSGKRLTLTSDASLELEHLTLSEGKPTNMTDQQKAEVLRALEENLGHTLTRDRTSREGTDDDLPDVKPSLKQQSIDSSRWMQKSTLKSDVDDDLRSITPSAELLRARQISRPSTPAQRLAASARSQSEIDKKKEADKAAFLRDREQAKREKKVRDAEAAAKAKKHLLSGKRAGEGSALNGIGNLGKEHLSKGSSIMVSSESEASGSDDEFDRELFGTPVKKKQSAAVKDYNENQRRQLKPQGPVKKLRENRSQKDLRARVAPDLSPLHQVILAWNYFHDSDYPPATSRESYQLVGSAFHTPQQYRDTFEPLLRLEVWQSLRQAREESSAKSFKLTTKTRIIIDNLIEFSSTMDPAVLQEKGVSEGDLLLLSRETANGGAASASQPNCLARVFKIQRKAASPEFSFRVAHGTSMSDHLGLQLNLRAEKVSSLIPVEREYGALLGLTYYDLCDEIIKAYPSPLLKYSDQMTSRLTQIYDLNQAQSKAVQSAVDNDAFTLIQGPPGSGKTKTVVAIVGALLTDQLRMSAAVPISMPKANGMQQVLVPKKLLVCAPSNAAVDELVMRFMQGVKTLNGSTHKASVLRLGRSETINSKVMEVTLDEQVKRRLELTTEKVAEREDIGQVMKKHQAVSEEIKVLRGQLDERAAPGLSASHEQKHQLEVLKCQKANLSNRIDRMRDSGQTQSRNLNLRRKHIQQEIIDGAHIVCATLSGSGHDMFRGLKIDFETVIIDEAAQSIELSALIPLKYGCSKCVMVGDPKQLPPTVLSRAAASFLYEQSLFVRMQMNSPENVHLLDTQYRMHPEISIFPSQAFYDGRLLDGPGMATARIRPWHSDWLLGPYQFFDVQGMQQSGSRGHSLTNAAEADVAIRLFRRLLSRAGGYDITGKVGVISPYKGQIALLRDRFKREFGEDITDTIDFNTTDSFQGRECEIIIFSCVRASPRGIGFLKDIRRMNVGITRAKSSLWVLGNSSSLSQGEFWQKMIENACQRNRYVAETIKALQKQVPLGQQSRPAPAQTRPAITSNARPEHYWSQPSKNTAVSTISDTSMPDAPSVDRSGTLTPSSVVMDVDSEATAGANVGLRGGAPPALETQNGTNSGASHDNQSGVGEKVEAGELHKRKDPEQAPQPGNDSKKTKVSQQPTSYQPPLRVTKPSLPRKKNTDDIFIKPKPRRK